MRAALAPRPLPKRTFVSLTAALTSLLYEHAFELGDLVSWARSTDLAEEYLRDALTNEWLELADYACAGSTVVRARRAGSSREIRLVEEDLRNCRYVGWWSPTDRSLSVDPFSFTFSGGFASNVERDLRGFVDVVVSRKDLLAYKKVRPRLTENISTDAWRAAERWLSELFETTEPMPGLKDSAVATMVKQFGITRSRAGELWTATAVRMRWPLRGRPSAAQKHKLESLIKEGRL